MAKADAELKPLVGERDKGESDNAVVACNDWLRMGAGRSMRGLIQKYQDLSNFQKGYTPPSLKAQTLYTWSSKFRWDERATAFDADYERIKNEERQAQMNYGAALDYERVRRLKRLADFLEGQIYERGMSLARGEETYTNIWLHDVKQVGSGDNTEQVDIERFNGALISEYRATLDDIAKEAGGRKQKLEGAIEVQRKPVRAEDLTDDELASLIASHINKANIPD